MWDEAKHPRSRGKFASVAGAASQAIKGRRTVETIKGGKVKVGLGKGPTAHVHVPHYLEINDRGTPVRVRSGSKWVERSGKRRFDSYQPGGTGRKYQEAEAVRRAAAARSAVAARRAGRRTPVTKAPLQAAAGPTRAEVETRLKGVRGRRNLEAVAKEYGVPINTLETDAALRQRIITRGR